MTRGATCRDAVGPDQDAALSTFRVQDSLAGDFQEVFRY
jgi:hypothetical protein